MRRPEVIIVDHGTGNIHSVMGALRALDVDASVSGDPRIVRSAPILVLPGVGSFKAAMRRLQWSGLDAAIRDSVDSGRFVLGICLGMQLLCSWSDEDGGSRGLGVLKATVSRFSPNASNPDLRVPHVGFNSVHTDRKSQLFAGIPSSSDFYFVHSFRTECIESPSSVLAATSDYGGRFISAFESEGHVMGVQFHPELSHGTGLLLLSNFIRMASCSRSA